MKFENFSQSPQSGDNHYKTLKVSPEASGYEIEEAFKRLAAQSTHQDTRLGSGVEVQDFSKLFQAYVALSDEEKRSAYDRQLVSGERAPKPKPNKEVDVKFLDNDINDLLQFVSYKVKNDPWSIPDFIDFLEESGRLANDQKQQETSRILLESLNNQINFKPSSRYYESLSPSDQALFDELAKRDKALLMMMGILEKQKPAEFKEVMDDYFKSARQNKIKMDQADKAPENLHETKKKTQQPEEDKSGRPSKQRAYEKKDVRPLAEGLGAKKDVLGERLVDLSTGREVGFIYKNIKYLDGAIIGTSTTGYKYILDRSGRSSFSYRDIVIRDGLAIGITAGSEYWLDKTTGRELSYSYKRIEKEDGRVIGINSLGRKEEIRPR